MILIAIVSRRSDHCLLLYESELGAWVVGLILTVSAIEINKKMGNQLYFLDGQWSLSTWDMIERRSGACCYGLKPVEAIDLNRSKAFIFADMRVN